MAAAAGIVLAGGRSSRMGQDKASLVWGGVALAAHVASTLVSVTEPVMVVAAPGQDLPEMVRVRVVRDRRPLQGPAEGLVTGLQAVRAEGASIAFVAATDMPLLHTDFISAVIAALLAAPEACLAVIPTTGTRRHPLGAAYRSEAAGPLESFIKGGGRRLMDFLDSIATQAVRVESLPHAESLHNANTPEELSSLRKQYAP